MNKTTRRCLAVALVLHLVSYTTCPASATTHSTASARGSRSASKDKGSFAISINDALPESGASEKQAEQPAEESVSHESIEQTLIPQTPTLASESEAVNADSHESHPVTKHGGFLSAWSLPISGPLELARKVVKKSDPTQRKELSASIDFSDPYDQFTQQVDILMDCALSRDPNFAGIEKAVNHYRKPIQKVIAESKDATNMVIPYRGFGPSKEAGDIILGENPKIKSRAAAEYARQKQVDETHLKVVSSMMQIAMGLGLEDKLRGQAITDSGVASLKELVGDVEAEKTKAMIAQMTNQFSIPDELYQKPAWDVQEKQKLHRQILQLSLEDDPVVHQITKNLHKYNQKSKFAMVSSSVIQTLLGAASLTPSFIGPAAKTALVAFVMATGGPEQCKLLKELYLDKRMDSRWKVINEEAHMALDNYQLALLTKNPVLLCYSESVVGQMIGGHHVDEVFGKSLVVANKPNTAAAM